MLIINTICLYWTKFFPQQKEQLKLLSFDEIAGRYLTSLGYKMRIYSSEEEARAHVMSSKTRMNGRATLKAIRPAKNLSRNSLLSQSKLTWISTKASVLSRMNRSRVNQT